MLSSSRMSSTTPTTTMNNKKFSTTSSTNESSSSSRKESADDKIKKSNAAVQSPSDAANKNNKTVESKEEQFKKFQGDGVQFKAKLIGSELVIEPRGDKICQDSIQRLKAIIRGQKAHKRRILLKISYAGIKVFDEKSNELLYCNEVPQISFIASDDTDARTFGYICDVPSKAHRFICFKTQGPAVQVMSVISLLFEAVLEQKNKEAAEVEQETKNKSCELSNNSTKAKTDQTKNTAVELLTGNLLDAATDNERDESDYLEFGYGSVARTSGPSAPAKASESTKAGAKHGSMLDLVNDELGDLFIVPPPPPLPARNESFESQLRSDKPLVKQSTLLSEGGLEVSAADSGILDSPSFASDFSACSPTQPINLQRAPNRRQQHAVSSSVRPSSGFMMTPSNSLANDDPFAAPTVGDKKFGQQNRSLIYNHSSVSLNEAALTRQSSFGASAQSQSGAGGTDKYAVFNDIDNLPSIFESDSSLNNADSVNKLNFQQQQPFFPASNQQQLANADSLFSASARGDFYLGAAAAARQVPHNNAPAQQQQQQFNKQSVVPTTSLFTSNNNNNFSFNNNTGSTTRAPQPFAPTMSARHQMTANVSIGTQGQQLDYMQQVRPSPSTPFGHTQAEVANSNLGLNSMVVGSAPMSGIHPQAKLNFDQNQQATQMVQDHARFSSSMMANVNQRLGSSTASLKSAGSATGLSRQTNPFDDEFFA